MKKLRSHAKKARGKLKIKADQGMDIILCLLMYMYIIMCYQKIVSYAYIYVDVTQYHYQMLSHPTRKMRDVSNMVVSTLLRCRRLVKWWKVCMYIYDVYDSSSNNE